MEQFARWYDAALVAGVRQADAMTLATATSDGRVSARTVLLRGHDARGFVWFTNLESAKGEELRDNPRAALVFHWREQERQVRATGTVTEIGRDEVARYWATRPREHRLGAWASPQSRVVADRAWLDAALRAVDERFSGEEPPVPPFWGGYRLAVAELELWQGRPGRLHDRVRYRPAPDAGGWVRERLAP
jgi:pyridoxamine 5'-phosphate oxidase